MKHKIEGVQKRMEKNDYTKYAKEINRLTEENKKMYREI